MKVRLVFAVTFQALGCLAGISPLFYPYPEGTLIRNCFGLELTFIVSAVSFLSLTLPEIFRDHYEKDKIKSLLVLFMSGSVLFTSQFAWCIAFYIKGYGLKD